jgi:hypothetical protein
MDEERATTTAIYLDFTLAVDENIGGLDISVHTLLQLHVREAP